ncbi:MAG: ATP-dependent DNA ligase [Firmicutes bacterium]|nr:ATP-dependent DNA ligase [Bacillota bacterium]
MLAVPASPFSHPDFLFEVKWDGYRCLAYLEAGTTLRSRNLRDLTPAFPELGGLHGRVEGLPALLDGEVAVFTEGVPDFGALQERGRVERPERAAAAAARYPAVYLAFDILYHRGKSLMERPLRERKEVLLASVRPGPHLAVPEGAGGEEGEAYFAAAVKAGLEGVVAKRLDGPYLPGRRSPLWRKIRAVKGADAVICGFEPGSGGRPLGSLILGAYRDGRLVYIGKVGTGFTEAEALALYRTLEALRVPTPSLPVPREDLRRPRWVRPCLVCTVHYAALTREGRLRHASFRGLRHDKEPAECGLPGAPGAPE